MRATLRNLALAATLALLSAVPAVAEPQTPPQTQLLTTANALTEMSPGWNLGNTLEAIGNGGGTFTTSQESVWGNAPADRQLFDAVHAAGFKSVRIPVAWNQYSEPSGVIRPFWLKRVKQVVDDARAAGLVVVINVHWDGGWLQPTNAARVPANARLAAFWNQIATTFRDYDDHLLFAGTNEIMVTNVWSPPTAENCAVQNSFNQTFVNAVRATGGNNASRFLVVQSYNTNIGYALTCNTALPSDTVAGRMMLEIHNYDPYDFTLNNDSKIWQWGKIATMPDATQDWANEAYIDDQFQKVKTTFVDKGVPVILGEYAASLKREYDPSGKYRTYWDAYLTGSAYRHGVIPMYWDSGSLDNHASGLFNRKTGAQAFPETISAIVDAAK